MSHASTATQVQYPRSVIGRAINGQPRTYRLSHSTAQSAAYRRLALAILGLDVATLATDLRSMRLVAYPAPSLRARSA